MDYYGTTTGDDGNRQEKTKEVYDTVAGAWYLVRTVTRGLTAKAAVEVTKEKVSGFAADEVSNVITIDPLGNTTTTKTTVDRAAKKLIRTTTRMGLNTTVAVYRAGLLQSENTVSVAAPRLTTYDGLGRVTAISDPNAGATTITYDPASGQPATIQQPGQTTVNAYYLNDDYRAGLLRSRTVNGKATRFDYDALRRLTYVWGGGTYPLHYEYDIDGRLWKLHTYRSGADGAWAGEGLPPGFAEEGDVTTWTYQPGSPLVSEKSDAQGRVTYFYYTEWGALRE